ncbi:MAG: Dam family site-specific DNA-(adenine-N6)-methyltransferase [Sphaerochaetaceae bacterium]|nr:Dam family site-specific DNA-(adenine-N6)-methyltransferase [Sphaerochaetaceae bacterium]
MANNIPTPFLKWAGGKGRLLPVLKKNYPVELGEKINKYIEPFVGSGAVLFDILSTYDIKEVYINDINNELINAYNVIKYDVESLIKLLSKIQEEYLILDLENRKKYFYKKRDLFNNHITENILNTETAALFIYLNKTCFNGLYRVNSKGLYNVPTGNYKNPTICNSENLRAVSKKLSTVNLKCGDYKNLEDIIDNNTFIYFDPPYRPLNKTSSFNTYTKIAFDDDSQIELANFIKRISNKGARILASNSDPKNTDPDDNFFDDLYSDMNIKRVSIKRLINMDASKRNNEITEILIKNY